MTDREPFCALFSFWYYRSPSAFGKVTEALHRARDKGQPVRVLVDSGAFSADTQGHRITVDEYAGWLRDMVVPEWGPWLVGALNLDVLRDAEGSWRNWRMLRELGFDTIPVTHLGDPVSVLDRYVDAGSDYIGLGAMVGKSMTRKLRWAAHVHKHVLTVHPEVRLHGLGLSAQGMVERLPWWSVDSSSFAAVVRFARLSLYDADARKLVTVHLTQSADIYKYRTLLRDQYGVDPDEVAWADKENRALLLGIGAKAMVAWQRAMRERNPVAPPPSRAAQGDGTMVSFVSTDGSGRGMAGCIDGSFMPGAMLDGTFVHSVDGQNKIDFPARLRAIGGQ